MKMTQQNKNKTKIKEKFEALPIDAKPVPNYPTYYATTNGEIWRICPKREQWGPFKHRPERIIKLNVISNPKYKYIQCQPYVNKKRKLAYVHIMVCSAFMGLPPTPKHEVNHIDYDKTNNHISNLEWVTRSENIRYSVCNRNYNYKYDIDYIIEQIKKGVSVKDVAAELGCFPNYVYYTCRMKKVDIKPNKKQK